MELGGWGKRMEVKGVATESGEGYVEYMEMKGNSRRLR